MTKRKGNILAPLLVLALIFPLAGIMIMREPQVAWMFILAAAILPIAWILIEVFKAPKSNDEAAIEDRATLRNSIFAAGLLIILPLGLTVVFSSGI
jgi:small-conductance mechanosensitive channel